MTTCMPQPSKTPPELTSLLPSGGRDPPAYITTYRTEAGGHNCSRRLVPSNHFPSCYHFAKEDDNGQRRLSFARKAMNWTVDVGWSWGFLGFTGDALIYV